MAKKWMKVSYELIENESPLGAKFTYYEVTVNIAGLKDQPNGISIVRVKTSRGQLKSFLEGISVLNGFLTEFELELPKDP